MRLIHLAVGDLGHGRAEWLEVVIARLIHILGEVVVILGPLHPPCDVELVIDDILARATFGMWRLWRNKNSRKRLADDAKKLIQDQIKFANSDLFIDQLGNPSIGLRFHLADETAQQRVIEGLRKWKGDIWHKPIQPELPFSEES